MLKAAGVAAGALFISIGLSAMLGGADLFAAPASQGHTVSESSPPAPPSPQASPSPQPTPQSQEVTAAGTIYTQSRGGPKKKHGKG